MLNTWYRREVDVTALIFKHRWAVEAFFNSFKHVLGLRYLLIYNKNGIELQTYVAIIACMLIGHKPTLRMYEMLCLYFTGMADKEELLAHIARLQKQD